MFNQNSSNKIVMSKKSINSLLINFQRMQELALEIKNLYDLLDDRNHELTYIAMRMENHFSELFQMVYGCKPDKHDFKSTIERICGDIQRDTHISRKTFFKQM